MTGVPGYSGGIRLGTEVAITGATGDDKGHVVLLTKFDTTLFTPANAILLGLRLILRGIAETIGWSRV
ncbi:hypothetical protein [Nocardia carnea]|uniref:hypothetical protein n=1 Tax=Nocardia carnea TaxID=37328 RepID=UPI002454B4CF|nr:hypothetical protein [Nocardia carnea]